MNNGRRRTGLWIYLIFMLVMVGGAFLMERFMNRTTETVYTEYTAYIEDGSVAEAVITQNKQTPTGQILFRLKTDSAAGNYRSVYVSDVNEEKDRLDEAGVKYTIENVQQDSAFLTSILPTLLMLAGVFLMFVLFTGRIGAGSASSGGGPMTTFTKSRARKSDPSQNPIRFNDVAGLLEEKEELEEIVDFLMNPQKYIELGARIPKGLLLVGYPGTGKTLLAKAVAGEAGVPFFSISGSDFVEMFVGVGASRVRDMFDEAKKNAPCIIFIDEIDAVARIRGSGMGGGHDEREQTLNQLLVEMDGFSVNEGIIVMAATNRADILDPAILRPGRFDRRVEVGLPDIKGREDILKVHARNKKMGDDVDLHRVAQTAAGFSGADLENLLNEAAIRAAKENRQFISQRDIEESFVKVGIGKEKKSKIISEEDRRITAYHEMGHAILFEALPGMGPVHTVSIIPTGLSAAGYTMPLPSETQIHYTKGRLLEEIMVNMGGRIAEEIILNDFTTGASQDIKSATKIARDMVMKYGMSDKIGFINYEQQEEEVFLGRDLGHIKTYGNNVYDEIEKEVKRIIDECYEKAKAIILGKKDVLEKGAALLLEQEKIGQQEFEEIYYHTEAAE
ncbi:MAG: ATP-dependent zinc metalloprotease FtsH [Lachnospiraceae bacterium]|nr:ATP-dependent zinc metalloprotease FtsH [Lachnospiraceae bacterium]